MTLSFPLYDGGLRREKLLEASANLEGAEAILHTLTSVYQAYQHKGKFIDLYCGCGTQTFLLESLFDEVYGVESNISSYQDALAFQKTRSSSKAKFICRKAETIFNTPMTKGVIAALHLNPPRTGISQRVMPLMEDGIVAVEDRVGDRRSGRIAALFGAALEASEGDTVMVLEP